MVNVSAKDLGTQKLQSMVVTGRQKLDPDQIQKMINDSKVYEEQDKRRREEVELKNQGDELAYQIDKLLSENGDKIPSDLKNSLESKVKELREALSQDNIGKIKILIDDIKNESMKVGQHLYQNQQGQQSNPADQGTSDPNDTTGAPNNETDSNN
jgi:molecular chaperone DnaK